MGNYNNSGQEWRPQGEPEKTLIHDFADKQLGKVIPGGIYDVGRNQGWVSVGIDHDTAEFAADSILAWRRYMGCKIYPAAKQLLMAAGGGCNASRSRLWKVGVQRLANVTGLQSGCTCFSGGHSEPPAKPYFGLSLSYSRTKATPL